MTICFTIHGNQDDPIGNPIPKLRMTGKQSWTPGAQRYAAWKEYVQGIAQPHILAAAIDMPPVDPKKYAASGRYRKPITLKGELRMDIKIHFANEHHADPESIYGSLADSIFLDDKHLRGKIDFCHAKDKKGKVDVILTIMPHGNI